MSTGSSCKMLACACVKNVGLIFSVTGARGRTQDPAARHK